VQQGEGAATQRRRLTSAPGQRQTSAARRRRQQGGDLPRLPAALPEATAPALRPAPKLGAPPHQVVSSGPARRGRRVASDGQVSLAAAFLTKYLTVPALGRWPRRRQAVHRRETMPPACRPSPASEARSRRLEVVAAHQPAGRLGGSHPEEHRLLGDEAGRAPAEARTAARGASGRRRGRGPRGRRGQAGPVGGAARRRPAGPPASQEPLGRGPVAAAAEEDRPFPLALPLEAASGREALAGEVSGTPPPPARRWQRRGPGVDMPLVHLGLGGVGPPGRPAHAEGETPRVAPAAQGSRRASRPGQACVPAARPYWMRSTRACRCSTRSRRQASTRWASRGRRQLEELGRCCRGQHQPVAVRAAVGGQAAR
jgi:hypothetical protein